MKRPPVIATRLLAPLAACAVIVSLGSVSFAKSPKKRPAASPSPTSQASSPSRAIPTSKPSAGGAVATPKKKPGGRKHGAPSDKATKPSASTPTPTKKTGHPAVAAIVRAENYQRQGRGVVEGEISAPVDGGTCPGAMAMVEQRYCVDKYEGTLVEVTSSGDERAWSPFETPIDGRTYKAASLPGTMPQGYISGAQAEAACSAAGKRLCKPVEWRKACMGPKNELWGYAASKEQNRCNDHGKSPMLHFYPQVNVSWKLVGMTEMNDPQLNQLDGALVKTGAHSSCTNDYGVYDMVGNLHEWTSDPNGTFQGGYYLDTHLNGDGCGYRTTAHEFTYHDYSTGFRCCADVVAPAKDTPTTTASP